MNYIDERVALHDVRCQSFPGIFRRVLSGILVTAVVLLLPACGGEIREGRGLPLPGLDKSRQEIAALDDRLTGEQFETNSELVCISIRRGVTPAEIRDRIRETFGKDVAVTDEIADQIGAILTLRSCPQTTILPHSR